MADRDLLNKPMPAIAPDGDSSKRGLGAPQLGKLGVIDRAREVGREADAKAPAPRPGQVPGKLPAAAPNAAPGAAAKQAAGQAAPAVQDKAFKAAYFNRDTTGIGAVNQRARPMAALRGEEGATDLRKVVLPRAAGAEEPNPEKLASALQRMASAASHAELGPDLSELLGRQADWARHPKVTPEMIAARQQALAAQVALRKQALARMRQLPPAHLEATPTLTQAVLNLDGDAAQAPDPQAEAEALVHATSRQGAGLMGRLAKVMGSKR